MVCRALLFFAFLLGSSVLAAEQGERPKVALVLSGGGALGYAHIGVLKVLEEKRIPVDCIAGTSMGALVGGAYAAGVSPEKMQAKIIEEQIATLFADDPPRPEISWRLKKDDYRPLFDMSFGLNGGEMSLPAGASAGYKIELFLKELMGLSTARQSIDFDHLPIPYRALATDLEHGKRKVFDSGELPRVMRASMSLPAVVSPIAIDGRLYVDGGLSNNLPVETGRALCGDVVIAVNLGTRPKAADAIQDSIDIALQSVVLLTEQNVRESVSKLRDDDILIAPDLQGFNASSFEQVEPIVARGVAAAEAVSGRLSDYALSEQAYRQWQQQRDDKKLPPVNVSAIDIRASGYVSADAVRRDVTAVAGEAFELNDLHNNITDIFGRGDFAYVSYSLAGDNEDTRVLIDADHKPWGPGFLRFGLGAAVDFSSPTQLNLTASYRRTWVNRLDAEWRTDLQIGYESYLSSEFIQPLQLRDGAFIAPFFKGRRHFVQFYDKSERIGDIEVRRQRAGIDIGVAGSKGELRLGTFVSHVESKPDFDLTGAGIAETSTEQKGVMFSGVYDQLDRTAFPRSGVLAKLDISRVDSSGSSVPDYTKGELRITAAGSVGSYTLAGHIAAGDELGDGNVLPLFDAFLLGGPGRLSGLYLEQLNGSRYQLMSLRFYRQYAKLPTQLGTGMYFGATLESGRINDPWMEDPWGWVASGSIFWGADTFLGPVYFGYGDSSLQQGTFYLMIGGGF